MSINIIAKQRVFLFVKMSFQIRIFFMVVFVFVVVVVVVVEAVVFADVDAV